VDALTSEDLAILNAESSTIAGHTLKIIVGEPTDAGAPTLEMVRSRVAERLDRVPRLRQRLAFDPKPAWIDDRSFSVDDHAHLVPAGESLVDRAAVAMEGRLDRERPLWDIELLTDTGDGRWALLWRTHHAMADGMTMMRWSSDLLYDAAPATAAAASKPGATTPKRANAVQAVADAARTALSLARELRPLPTDGPFDGRVGNRRAVAFARCRLDDLRTIEHEAGQGVTVNDVVLAAVAGSIRRWCQEHGGALEKARAKVPVSMHHAGPHADDGNRDSFLFVDLPLDEPDAQARLRAVNRESRERKTRHDADAVFEVLGTLDRLAPPLARLAGRMLQNPREFAVNVSNVPGPRDEVRVLGRRVSAMYSLAEIAERHPLRVSAVSLHDSMQFGFCVDPELVPGVETLATGVEDSVAELLEA